MQSMHEMYGTYEVYAQYEIHTRYTQIYNNIQYYLDISIEQMSDDFELIRKHLKIDRWLVFGGSWGSTLGLDYAERYPAKCLGLIIRGIYLNTKEE